MENGKALFRTDPGGWIHIAPFGEHPHSCGVIQVIDRRACDAMVSAFEARRAKEGETFAGVLLDYDHFSMDTDKPSEAAGWIVELATRDDGLCGRVRWTDTGLKAVEGGRYCTRLEAALDASGISARQDIVLVRELNPWAENAAAVWTGGGDAPVVRVTRWDASGGLVCDRKLNRPGTVAEIEAAIGACALAVK